MKIALLLVALFFCVRAFAADDVPSLVEVDWRSKKQISIPNATSVIPLNPEQVNAELTNGVITFYGIARGAENVVLVFVNDKPVSIRVNVVDPPALRMAPRLKDRSEFADVILSSSMQTSSNAVGLRQYGFTNGVSWQQALDPTHRFEFNMESTAGSLASSDSFNLNHGNVSYFAPNYEVSAIDFPLNLFASEGSILSNSLLATDYTALRGVEVTYHRRRTILCPNRPVPTIANSLVERRNDAVLPNCGPSRQEVTTYRFYAGTTQPYYFLTLGGTSNMVGFNFNHRVNERFSFFGNSAFTNVPLNRYTPSQVREKNFTETIGFTWHVKQHWHFSSTAGMSTSGGMARGEARYSSRRLDAGAAAAVSSARFPFNQLLNTTAGTQDYRTNLLYHSSDRLTESFNYTHSSTKQNGTFIPAGTYQYAAPGIDFLLNGSNDINLQYAWSEATTAGQKQNSSSQYIVSWNSLLPRQVSNAVQLTIGSVQDPLQLHTGDEWNIRDSVRLQIPRGTLMLNIGHNETDPSLAQRVYGRLGLLPLALQQAFLNDPVGFLNSGSLPADVRAIVEANNPAGTYLNVNAQMSVTRTLSFSPNFAFSSISNGATTTWSPTFGYGLQWSPTRSLQLNSNLSTVWYSDNTVARRTSVFSFGVVKQLFVAPSAILPSRARGAIIGRVFRDNNINGTFNAGEPGLAGIRVQLDEKETTTTDAQGRYRFGHVSGDVHQVRIAVSDIKGPIRMTTPSQLEANTVRTGSAEVNFGVVNFAKIMGLVFNDAKFAGQPDITSKGLKKVRMTLKNAAGERTIVSEGSGEYESTDIAPGDYELSVDQASLPANYWVPKNSIAVHVDPVSTSVIDVPVRALRSIGGRVLLRVPKDGSQAFQNAPQNKPGDYETVAVAGITIVAGDIRTQTAADGSFLLRNLPAGELTVTIAPVKQLPEGMKLPAGRVRLPDDPTEVHDATIVISNPALIPYLVGKTVEQIRKLQPGKNSPEPFVTTAKK